MKYICGALAVGAGISLAAYLAMAKCINALGEAVEGIGDVEDEFFDWPAPVLERTAIAQADFDRVFGSYAQEYPPFTERHPVL